MRLPLPAIFGLLLTLVASVLGAAIFGGLLRDVAASPLVADVRLQPLTLPSGFSLDKSALAATLVSVLQDRVRKDVGLSVLLGDEATKQLREAALPRLVNPELMTRMIEAMPAFAAMTAAAQFRALAEITISNRGSVELEDVAVTLPELVLAEAGGDARLTTKLTENGLPAARIGPLPAGGTVVVRAWFSAPLSELLSMEDRIRVGASGVDGTVHVHGRRGWPGEDFETLVWGRWLVWALLAALALASAGALGFAIHALVTDRWRKTA